MLVDARTVPDGSRIEADVCIVGAGAAGITMARELRRRPLRVVVLESGGLEPDRATRSLSRGEVTGHPYFRLDQARSRCLGGTTEQWTIANGRTFGHSFHIHDVQFAIVSRSTGAVPAHEQGWKDTFFIRPNESVAFVARFADFSSAEHPYMYHCHMSNHEDEGLMAQFLVVP